MYARGGDPDDDDDAPPAAAAAAAAPRAELPRASGFRVPALRRAAERLNEARKPSSSRYDPDEDAAVREAMEHVARSRGFASASAWMADVGARKSWLAVWDRARLVSRSVASVRGRALVLYGRSARRVDPSAQRVAWTASEDAALLRFARANPELTPGGRRKQGFFEAAAVAVNNSSSGPGSRVAEQCRVRLYTLVRRGEAGGVALTARERGMAAAAQPPAAAAAANKQRRIDAFLARV